MKYEKYPVCPGMVESWDEIWTATKLQSFSVPLRKTQYTGLAEFLLYSGGLSAGKTTSAKRPHIRRKTSFGG